jgi:hypothetical protein
LPLKKTERSKGLGQAMKTKNQTEQAMLELPVTSAANEEGFSAGNSHDAAQDARNQAWSPYEVWRTRVKTAAAQRTSSEPAQI